MAPKVAKPPPPPHSALETHVAVCLACEAPTLSGSRPYMAPGQWSLNFSTWKESRGQP